MDYRILVFFVFLHCSINALPYEEDSRESGDLTVNLGNIIQKLLQDKQPVEKPLELGKRIIIDNPKPEDKDSPKPEDKNSPKPEDKDNPKPEDKDNLKPEDKDVPKLEDKDNPKPEDKDNPKPEDKDIPKPAGYAVTELVIDIPDDTPKGPIVTNFSIAKPLNIASNPIPSLDKDKNTNNSGNDLDKGKETEETDEKEEGTGIKEYFNGIKQGIVNGFNSIVLKRRNSEENHTDDFNTGPFNFFNKIHKKSSDFAQKIHNSIFGGQKEDNF
ncbi:immunoglobulin G-binding protein A-like [Maniola jurtina]|uniref:immunoglobulin G-binding protein A-like n=1 Tax=Maniola jurtina TaxID=191418 RepID=UPI001E686454|nr:immunoglobulin G-binding protein A-like [Maniola jurtina]